MQLNEIPFFEELKNLDNILIAGAGGGFDVYSGIPLYFALKKMGKTVHFANFAFTMLSVTTAERLFPPCYEVRAKDVDYSGFSYFPEKYLAEWLSNEGIETSIYAFERTGLQPLKRAYDLLIDKLNLEAIVLVDGGTDSLMFGDESGLGTPVEDICSMGAVFQSKVAHKYLLCLGFGVDHYHGVSHYRFLENVSTVMQAGGYLGSIHVLPQMEESKKLVAAVNYSNEKMPFHNSIVANSIVSSLEGHYGDFHRTNRTTGGELWINPLMTIYWCFQLESVIKLNQYYDQIKDTETLNLLNSRLATFRRTLGEMRGKKQLPI